MLSPWVRLYYTFTRTQESIDYKIHLQTTRPSFGGLHWWFTCTLLRLRGPCQRRVAKLYLALGCRFYGCRHYYNLTYESCQESDKRLSFLRKHPEALMALLDGQLRDVPTSRLLLGLKVLGSSGA